MGGISKTVKSNVLFILDRIKKLYFLYWPVFILGLLYGAVSGQRNPLSVYSSIGEMIRDFMGLAYIVDGETVYNGAWWYISFALTLYIVFPLLHRLVVRFPKTLLCISFIVGIKQMTSIAILIEWQRYFFVCCLGIFLAENHGLDRLINFSSKSKRILLSGFACVVFLLIRCLWAFTFDAFFAVAIIVFSVTLFGGIKTLKKILVELGIYSGNMFLVHGLLYKYFLHDFIYGLWYPILIWGILLILSFAISYVIEGVKKRLFLLRKQEN